MAASLNYEIRLQEQRRASSRLAAGPGKNTVLSATLEFFHGLDEVIAAARLREQLSTDCQAGCDYCCHFKVDVRAHEVFSLVHFLKQEKSPAWWTAFEQRLEDNLNTIRQLTQQQHLHSNIACPLLENHQCSAYSRRPALCRKFHSRDRHLCEQNFAEPDTQDLPSPEHRVIHSHAMYHIHGFTNAIRLAGLDGETYELNRALFEALHDDTAEKRWMAGEKAFSGQAGA